MNIQDTSLPSNTAALGTDAVNLIPDPKDLESLKGKVSEEEWALRCDLAALYRLTGCLWLDGPCLYPHFHAPARRRWRAAFPDQSLRPLLRGDHGLQSRQD